MRLQKQKAKLNPLVAACDFICYSIFQVLCDLHVSIIKFYLSALPSFPPVCSSERSLSVSFLALLSATKVTSIMAETDLERRVLKLHIIYIM
jgi:hypothetical protein